MSLIRYIQFLSNFRIDSQKARSTEAQLKNSLKSLKFQNPTPIQVISIRQASEMASLSQFRWQNGKERQKGSTNNGDMVDKTERYVVSE